MKKNILLIALILVSLMFSEKKLKIAVGTFNSKNSNIVKIISMNIQSTLVDLKLFSVIEREQLDKVLNEQSLTLSGGINSEDAVKIGKLVNAKYLVVGNIIPIENKLLITSRVVDVQSGKILVSAKGLAYLENVDSILKISTKIAYTIAEKITGKKLNFMSIGSSNFDLSQIKGYVLKVSANKITLSLNSSDKIKKGDKFIVYGWDFNINKEVKKQVIVIKKVMSNKSIAVISRSCLKNLFYSTGLGEDKYLIVSTDIVK